MQDRSTSDIETLIDLMAKLPGMGPRSARRAVLHLVRKRGLLLTPLSDAMSRVATTARECLNCGNVGTTDICDICEDETRANGELCVVESVSDLWAARSLHSMPSAPKTCAFRASLTGSEARPSAR